VRIDGEARRRRASGSFGRRRLVGLSAAALSLAGLLTSCGSPDAETGQPTRPLSIAPADARIRFAVIGDYGTGRRQARAVADLVKSWSPDFIITTGDNNYPRGGADTIDKNIGRLYGAYIAPYKGQYGPGATTNRFFPSIGNHDLHADDGKAYFDYFTLPGNERYYEFTAGPVHFFALNSDFREPDGRKSRSTQGDWLRKAVAASDACWRVAYFHHPPYASSGKQAKHMRWPFAEWGIDLAFAGHLHAYERLFLDGVTYVIVGLSGGARNRFEQVLSISQARYREAHGALLATVRGGELTLEFINRHGTLIDRHTMHKECTARGRLR
jgi:tartrate-resistant acid phosphatase type 5